MSAMLKDQDWCLAPHDCPGFKKFEKVSQAEAGEHVASTEYIHLNIPKRYGLVNITSLLEQILKRSGLRDGLCYVGAMHITAGIYINDAEGGLLRDISR